MLDLNVDALFSAASASCDDDADLLLTATAEADSVTSTTTSTTNNAAEADCNSSTGKDAMETINFSILTKNGFEIEDDAMETAAQSRNELQLFPIDAPFPYPYPSPASVRAKHWLDLSVPENYGGGGVELGVPMARFPADNQAPPPPQPQVKKSRRGPRSRSSQYRGVTFYRRTGRWESHIWDCGKQVYLGGFDTAHDAARAYDRAAIKFRGVEADINFTVADYEDDMKQMKNLSKEEFIHILRRQSTGFSRGSSKYRGVTLHKCGRWEARMGQLLGKKAYDKAAIKCNGREAVTNFEPSNYEEMDASYNDGGNQSSLNLNLGISLSSDGARGNENTNMLFLHASSKSSNGRILQDRATGKNTEAVSTPGFSNWDWKMPNHGSASALVPFLSSPSAASSGFSSPTTQYFPHT